MIYQIRGWELVNLATTFYNGVNSVELSKDIIMKEFSNSDTEELTKKYSKKELREYYQIVYGREPHNRLRNIDLVKAIQMMKRGIDRAQALKP